MAHRANLSILDRVEDLFTVGKFTPPTHLPKKILIVGPEVTPYASVGGVSRVLAHLSSALLRQGHDVRIFMPKFGSIAQSDYELEMVYEGLRVPTGDTAKPELLCNVKTHQLSGRARVYFLENREYYELRANVYGYADDSVRWALLSRGALEFIRCYDEWKPDIIHANDWQTGYVPNFMRTVYADDDILEKVACVYTIHNLSYQGMFDHKNVSDLDSDDGKSPLASFFDERLLKQNSMRRGIMYADFVNTVSPTYAREIMRPERGEGLDRLITEVRSKTTGILNGIDYKEYNPSTDPLISVNYDMYSLEKRVQNKIALQNEFDLEVNETIPIVGYVGRLESYKGLGLLLEVIEPLLRDFRVQFIFVGGGDGGLTARIRELQSTHPGAVGAHLMWDSSLPKLIFAGADIVTVPSKFEPCGLPQMEGMRYGAIPIVHSTGGLADSVDNFDAEHDKGFGFVFRNYDTYSLFAQIVRALEVFGQRDLWRKIQRRAMMCDNSWDSRAIEYDKLYNRALELKRRDLQQQGKITFGQASDY